MRSGHILAIASCVFFGTAAAMPRQDQPLAEQQFKNIQSFKGSKASDVIPAMEFMSASLGVGCDYCHSEDRASDTKAEKRTAREMIAMQRDINERHFPGRNEITCASCHRGHTRPSSVPPVEGGQVRLRRSDDVQVDTVLAAYSKAAGEPRALPGLRVTGVGISHGVKTRVEGVYLGDKFTFTSTGAKATQRMGFDGKQAWFTTPDGVSPVPLVYAAPYLRQRALYCGAASLPKLDNASGATAQIAGRDVLAIMGTIQGSTTRATFYFDKKSGLLTRTLFVYPSILGRLIQTNDYADYRKVGGRLVAMTVVNHDSNGDTVTRFAVAKVDDKINPATFELPK